LISLDIDLDVVKWEKDYEGLLKRFQAILREFIKVARVSATGKLQIVRRGDGPTEVQGYSTISTSTLDN
jgi:hypothetical protein